MKSKLILNTGKLLMRMGKLRICIFDDEASYFTPQMLRLAEHAGFMGIERYYKIDRKVLGDLLKHPPDIVILDIKGITTPDVAKDGFHIAKLLYEQTKAYVVITSAHKFHLHEYHRSYDYVLEERLLTAVDFIDELRNIIEEYLKGKIRFYRKVTFRIGYKIVKRDLFQASNR